MKRLLFLLAFLTALLVSHANLHYAQSFKNDDIVFDLQEIDSTIVATPIYNGLDNFGLPGNYYLPIKYVKFSVPYNAINFTIKIGRLGKTFKEYEYEFSRCDTEYSEIDENGELVEHAEVSDPIRIANVGYIDGCNKIVTIEISPVIPATKDSVKGYFLYHYVDFNLKWDLAEDLGVEQLCPVWPKNQDIVIVDRIKSMVENAADVEKNATSGLSMYTVDPQVVDYVVISDIETPLLKRFLELKELKGYSTELTPLSYIKNKPEYANLQDVEKIRSYIQYMYEYYNTKYFMFVGKFPQFPAAIVNYHTTIYDGIPTDLYFSDLNTKWSFNSDGTLAMPYNIDYYSEVNIGRIPASNGLELDNYLEKAIKYEWNPGNGDASYLGRAFMSRQNIDMYENGLNYTDVDLSTFKEIYGDNLIDYTDNNSFPNGTDVINKLNETKCGHFNFIGHGNPGGVAVRTEIIEWKKHYRGVVAIDEDEWFHVAEVGNGLNCLNNKDYPAWSHSMSCATMPFDIYIEKKNGKNTPYNVRYNFGESFILGKDYGGIAYIGNTRPSWRTDGVKMEREFYKLLIRDNIEGKSGHLNCASIMANDIRSISGLSIEGRLMHNYFGDPAIDLWCIIPQKLSYVSYAPKDLDEYTYSINNDNSDVLSLGRKCLFGSRLSATMPFSEETLNNLVEPNVILTVHGPKTLPLTLPLYLSGFNFTENQGEPFNIQANDVYVGQRPEITSGDHIGGDVYLYPGADVVIEAMGNVSLRSGIIIEPNASLTIIADGIVDIYNLTVPSNAKLTVEAEQIIYESRLNNFLDGSIVNFVERNPKQNLKTKHANKKAEPLVVEGRSWWYHSSCFALNEESELGLTIGKSVVIDGEEWHEVLVVKSATYDMSSHAEKESSAASCVTAYIREDNGRIYARFVEDADEKWVLRGVGGNNFHGVVRSNNYPDKTLVYDYNMKPGDKFFSGSDSESVEVEVNSISDILNSGNTFLCYDGKILNSNSMHSTYPGEPYKFIEKVGFVTEEQRGEVSELFYAPLGIQTDGTIRDDGPWLRYVTEGSDNDIIYEGIGGMKFWETTLGVGDVTVDNKCVAPCWYTIQGMKVDGPTTPGVYVKVVGNTATKVIVK